MTASQLIKTLRLYEDIEYCSFDVPMLPSEIISWRGSYSEPAILCACNSYSKTSVKEWIEFFQKVEGKEVTGHKGGDYVLSEDSDLWLVSSSREPHHTGISHVTCVDDFEVIVHTCYQKY